MKKYKLLRFGQCYINNNGDFVVGLLHGNRKHGYVFAASHANPSVVLGTLQTLSRIVPNDGRWTEITPEQFNVASALHWNGQVMQMTANGIVVASYKNEAGKKFPPHSNLKGC